MTAQRGEGGGGVVCVGGWGIWGSEGVCVRVVEVVVLDPSELELLNFFQNVKQLNKYRFHKINHYYLFKSRIIIMSIVLSNHLNHPYIS